MSADILRRYLASQGMAAQLTHRRAHYPLAFRLHQRLRAAPTAPVGRRSRSAPPGAFRTAWGWRRISRAQYRKAGPSLNATG
jgi:hypothetical protein